MASEHLVTPQKKRTYFQDDIHRKSYNLKKENTLGP